VRSEGAEERDRAKEAREGRNEDEIVVRQRAKARRCDGGAVSSVKLGG
jgi:hypothetical protein